MTALTAAPSSFSTPVSSTSAPFARVAALDDSDFARVRMRAIFECCKWDPQVEDISVLSRCALVLSGEQWRAISRLAERLERETLAMEREVLTRPDLHHRLSLPRRLRSAIRRTTDCAGTHGLRVTRYDFHHTSDGWRISEANTDVPGGFIEAAGFTSLIAQHVEDSQITGDPAAALAAAIRRRCPSGFRPRVGLVHATAYVDDRQVMEYLSRRFDEHDMIGVMLAPDACLWRDDRAHALTPGGEARPLDAIFRFFPAEWLPNLPRRSGWRQFLGRSRTMLTNPGSALLTQSKRCPLVWDELEVDLPTWRTLLPRTLDPRHAPNLARDDAWVVKPALGRVGSGIGMPRITTGREWKSIERNLRRHPRCFIVQRRFDATPIDTPDGLRYPVLGVFVIDGRAAGIYGRMRERPLINHLSQDVAVLVERAEAPSNNVSSPIRERVA